MTARINRRLQPYDAALAAIAALSPSSDDIIQWKSGAWTNRTLAQVRTDLGMFPSGTFMLFQQTTAPVGWTKQTTHNDKALRVVSGTAGSGGSSNFSTVFGKTATNSHTLSVSQIPSHDHDIDTTTRSKSGSGSNVSYITGSGANTKTTENTGGGGSHSHVMDNRVRYVDLIIAKKD